MSISEPSGAPTQSVLVSGQTILGRYTLQRLLGQGGMGVVWLARDEKLTRDVALKFLPSIVVNDRASLSELKREMNRTLELTHPNIVRTYDFIQDEGIAGISMEYMDGDTLRNRRFERPNSYFHPGEISEWVRQLCEALDYAHWHAAIVHCDLKPANLMVNSRGALKVTDFGISRSLAESMTQHSRGQSVSGTLLYMSPQQMHGDTPSPLDDVYAVGATLYELLTSKPPFYAGEISVQVASKVPPSMVERRLVLNLPGGEIPESWEQTIAACLSKDPGARPQSAGEIAVRLGLIDAAALPPRPASSRLLRPLNVSTASFNPGPSTSPTMAATIGPGSPTMANTISSAGGPPTGGLTSANTSPNAAPVSTATSPIQPQPVNPIVLIAVAAVALVLLAGGAWYFGFERPEAQKRDKKQTEEALRLADQKHADEVAKQAEEKKKTDAEHLADAKGNILLKTEPSDALVQVGDQPAKPSTGVISGVKAGRQTVKVFKDGFEPIEIPVDIKDGETANLMTVSLVRSSGALAFDGAPAGVDVKYELHGKTDADFVKSGVVGSSPVNVPTGAYTLTTIRDGWPAQSQDIVIGKGDPKMVKMEFPVGTVVFSSTPPGAAILIDGKDTGKKTPSAITDVPPGEMKYSLALDGYAPSAGSVTVQSGIELPVNAPLTKKEKGSTGAPQHVAKIRSGNGGGGSSVHVYHGRQEEGHAPSSAWEKAAAGIQMFRAIRGY